MFLHSVLFWLRDDLTDGEVAWFEKGLDRLTSISSVRFNFIGKPASTRRAVIDHSYSYQLVVGFDSLAGHDAYQEDKVHLAFIRDFASSWTRVQVYDADAISSIAACGSRE